MARIRKLLAIDYELPAPKVGHSGTLDPFASGVLIIAVGGATRLIEYTHVLPKIYQTTFILGATSDTDDITGAIKSQPVSHQPSPADIERARQLFIGSIRQIPPAYSAVKIAGEKMYQMARRGLPAAPVPDR